MSSTQWQTMADVETKTAARVLPVKMPPTAWDLWRVANYEKAQKEAQTKDMIVVAKKLGQCWKALKPTDKAKFEADAKKQKDKYFAFLATDAGKKAVAARREALKAKKIKKANKAVKAVSKSYKLKSQSTRMSAYYMFMADNWKKSKGMNGPAVVKEMAPKWKKLSDKEKKPYVDKAISAKTDREAYLKSATGLKVIREYNAALKPVKEKLMMLKKKKTNAAKNSKKVKTAKKSDKAKAKQKPIKTATKAKSTKPGQSSSFGNGIELCSAMKATPALEAKPAIRYLLNPGRERLTEVEMMILHYAAQAKRGLPRF